MDPGGRALYGETYRAMVPAVAERAGPTGRAGALDARRPRARYPAGKGARIMGMMARLLPQRLLDRLRLRVLGLPGAPVAADT